MALLLVVAPLVAAVAGLLVGRSRSAAAAMAIVGTTVSLVIAIMLWLDAPWDRAIVGTGSTMAGSRCPSSPWLMVYQ